MKWVDIKGFEGIYQVNRRGDVRVLPRRCGTGANPSITYIRDGRIMKASLQRGGRYLSYMLRKNGKYYARYKHRLVAEHFIPNPKNLPEVNHKNGIKTDCYVKNLQWVTPPENSQHAWQNGLMPRGSKRPMAKLTESDIPNIRKYIKTKSGASIARMYGVSPSTIFAIIKKRVWKHV